MNKIITILLAAIMLTATAAFMPAGQAYAACTSGGNSAKAKVLQGISAGGADCRNSESKITNVVAAAVRIMGFIIGIASVLAIMFGAFKYLTSAGESGRVSNAKQTILYALVGLVVAALAQVIVHFILFNLDKATGYQPVRENTGIREA